MNQRWPFEVPTSASLCQGSGNVASQVLLSEKEMKLRTIAGDCLHLLNYAVSNICLALLD